MKKLTLSLIGLLIGLVSYSQQPFYQWDTVIGYDSLNNVSQMHIQTFNFAGEPIEQNVLVKIPNGGWNPKSRNIFTYNYQSNPVVKIKTLQFWTGSYWKNQQQEVYYYNVFNDLLSHEWWAWVYNSTAQDTVWTKGLRQLFTYDSVSHLVTFETDEYASPNYINWESRFRYSYHYISTNYDSILNEISYDNGLTWKNLNLSVYTYTFNDKMLSSISKKWINSDSNWVNNYRLSYVYDANEYIIGTLLEDWHDTIWGNLTSNIITNNSFGNKVLAIYREWGDTLWVSKLKFAYTYDNSNNYIIAENAEGFTNNTWSPTHATLFLVGDQLNPIGNGNYTIQNCHKYEATYQHFYAGIEELSEGFKIFPNPTTDFINFSDVVKDFRLYNAYGQLLLSDKDVQKVDLTSFSKGVYIAEIDNSITKIVKQ